MMNIRIRKWIATAPLGAGLALLGAPASADSGLVNGIQYTIESPDGAEGTTDIGNYHILFSDEESIWDSTRANPKPVAFSQEFFGDYVYIFGNEYQLLFVEATGSSGMDGTVSPVSYTETPSAQFSVLGNVLQNGTPTACGSSGTCASVSESFSQTLFSTDATFTVGFVPVDVSASVVASLSAGGGASAYSRPFAGRQGQLLAEDTASLNANAYAAVSLSASAGIPDVLAVGVTGTFKLINMSVSPSAHDFLLYTPTTASVSWYNTAQETISTMDGSVDVWAEVSPLYTPTLNLVSWSGFTLSNQTLWNDSGQQTF